MEIHNNKIIILRQMRQQLSLAFATHLSDGMMAHMAGAIITATSRTACRGRYKPENAQDKSKCPKSLIHHLNKNKIL